MRATERASTRCIEAAAADHPAIEQDISISFALFGIQVLEGVQQLATMTEPDLRAALTRLREARLRDRVLAAGKRALVRRTERLLSLPPIDVCAMLDRPYS